MMHDKQWVVVLLLWMISVYVTSCMKDTTAWHPEVIAVTDDNSDLPTCAGGAAVCALNTSCCENEDGSHSCCPVKNAVCCQDKTHCCPRGTACDLKNGQCRGQVSSPLMKKINAVRLPKDSVVCPDHRSSCPDFYTCCPAPLGGFKCCPAPQAMCCPDKQHCCPHGSKCDSHRGQCDRGNKVRVPWFTKIPARPIAFGQIICPGGQFECPTGSTCCRLTSGDWGCCPLPQAVCCEDSDHCCPRGFTCNQKLGSCQKDDEGKQFVRWINLTDKHGLPPTPPNTICPSGKYKCPSEQTCCPRKEGLYGCCPFVEGTCCSDEKHCCPKGYECDLTRSKCVKGEVSALLLSTLRGALDIRVPTSYQQLQNMLNAGYLLAPAKSKSPLFSKLPKLNLDSEVQPQNVQKRVVNQKKQVSQQQVKQPHQQKKLSVQKQQPQQFKQQQQLKQQQQQQLKLQQFQQNQREKQAKPNVQQTKKPLTKNKPIIQQARVVNQTPQGQRQVHQTKPCTNQANRIDLKKVDPKMAEASRKAKIAMAVTKNAQILRKLHSVDLNVCKRPTEHMKIKPNIQLKPKPVVQAKTQKGVLNLRDQTTLKQEQVKTMQKQHLKNLQQNIKQNPQQNKANAQDTNIVSKHNKQVTTK